MMPLALPIGAAHGIHHLAAASTSRIATLKSSCNREHLEPILDQDVGGLDQPDHVGCSVSLSAITSSLIHEVANSCAASFAVVTASRTLRQPAVFAAP